MHIADLRKILRADLISYQELMEALKSYKKPRDKVTQFLDRGELIRIRKGLYIFSEPWRKEAIDHYLLANFIYGPSYISFETALSHYGLIPERVEVTTSVTLGRNKKFVTPLGVFTYQSQSPDYYTSGMVLEKRSWGNVLLATPEKALVDKLIIDRHTNIKSEHDLEVYLFEDLRVDLQEVQKFKMFRLQKIRKASNSELIALLIQYVQKIKKI